MTTIFITCLVLVFFFGFVIGKCSEENNYICPLPPRDNICSYDYVKKCEKVNELQEKLYWSEVKNHRLLNYPTSPCHNCIMRMCPCHCEPRIYAKSVKEQEFIDIITKGQKTATQLAKDLNLN